ncbi:hypothetical protein [Rhizobium sp. Root274]|uniref:hypothetical protein n=1 Tax=Rhizobium sp. Root274 TaxID=1736507 RepID=UPI0012E32FE2|nr:hypothetical protein [Rhizobium sp. Root274]
MKREAKIIASMLGGLIGTSCAIFLHFFIWMKTPLNSEVAFVAASLLLGFPTPGGAPYEIHLYNHAVWSFWGAVLYGMVVRICFGRLSVRRVLTVYVAGMAVIAVAGKLAEHGLVSGSLLGNGFLVAYVVVGLFAIRDWPARTSDRAGQIQTLGA